MTKETKHTPTPWRSHGTNIFDYNGRSVSNTLMSNFTYNEDEANAAHIVKCVNMHDELVEALDKILDNNNDENWHNALNVLKKAGAL